MSRAADLVDYQLRQLRATLRCIKSSNNNYAQHLQGLCDDNILSIGDLRRFPFLTKEKIRDSYPFALACRPASEFVRVQMSSGTTGAPIICPYTSNDVLQWAEVMARCLSTAGIGRHDTLQVMPSFGLFNGGFGFHYGATALETMIIPIGSGRTRLQLKFLRDLGTTAIGSLASYPLRLIEVAARDGFDFVHETKLRVGILGGEVWSDQMRRRIEDAMGIETFDIIGLTEAGGVGMGIDCPEHNGIHVWEDHFLIEIVSEETGEVLEDGEYGEMVVTTLSREALPLVRFRTGDLTRVVGRGECRCGRTSVRIDRIARRVDDMLKIKGVSFYPGQVESLLLQHREVGSDYLIEIDRVDGADYLRILVEASQTTSDNLANKLNEELFSLVGLHADITILALGDLPRSEGKKLRVNDKRR